jgi:ubiquinone biosynthesis protein
VFPRSLVLDTLGAEAQERENPAAPCSAMGQSRLRVIRIYAVTARVLASYGWLELQRPFIGDARYMAKLGRRHRANARRIERAIVRAGGLFIKVGQLISILTNFLPEDFRGELEGLQDQLPPRPYADIEWRIRHEFGVSPDELFAEFDRTPIATASLAQVHAARLHDGRRVAVKVQHADIERVARADLELIGRLLRIVQWVVRVRGLEAYHPEISQMIAEELDFTKEASNIESIGARFGGVPGVRCPTVVGDRSTRHVLTTEFIDGTKITDFAALADRGLDRRALAERIVGAYCRMIFVDGVYHADPHPGNILVAPDGAIVFIDFGAVGVLGARMREGVTAFVDGMVRRDLARITMAMDTMGFVAREAGARHVAERVITYAQQRIFSQITQGPWGLGDLEVDMRSKLDMLSDLRKLDVSFRELSRSFQVPKDWVLLERTLLLLLGLCTELDPSWNPMTVIRPYLEDVVLGEDRDWTELVKVSMKEMAKSAVTIPENFQRLITRADRGELEVRVPEIANAARTLYAAAHQLIFTILGVAAGVVAYQAYDRGRASMAAWLASASAVFILALFLSIAGTRRRL